MNTNDLYIVCTESGTIIPLHHARIIDTEDLTEDQEDVFTTGGDSEISELALEIGKPVAPF
jgi:hypothetical protein